MNDRRRPQHGRPNPVRTNPPARNRQPERDISRGQQRGDRGGNQRTAAAQSSRRGSSGRKRPRRNSRVFILVAAFLVVALGLFYGLGSFLSRNKILPGVTVAGIDVGGLSTEEAASLLTNNLNERFEGVTVSIYGDESAAEEGQRVGGAAAEGFNHNAFNAWSQSNEQLSVHVDSSSLAQEAYNVGRGKDFLLGRLAVIVGLRHLDGSLVYDEEAYESLTTTIATALGTPMVESTVVLGDDGRFTAVSGSDGTEVDDKSFRKALDQAFLSENHSFVVKMQDAKQTVNTDRAQKTADYLNSTMNHDITLDYGDQSWTIPVADLKSLVSFSPEEGKRIAKLEARTDADKLASYLKDHFLGDQVIGRAPRDATFYVYDGTITLIPSVDGISLDYDTAAVDMDALYKEGEKKPEEVTWRVELDTCYIEPELTTEEAEAMNINECISSYTIEYNPWATNNVTNIRLLSNMLNGSLVAPHTVFSINEVAGDCNAEKGFVEAAAYFAGEQIKDVGGGICQVATTLFNAVFNAGYPIAERQNHYFYVPRYPDGLDATVSYPEVDFKFENDTDDWMFISIDAYTDYSVTCTIWGTSPGYSVETSSTEPHDKVEYDLTEIVVPDHRVIDNKLIADKSVEGVDGHRIEVTRKVYYKNGTLKSDSTFDSYYRPKSQVDLVRVPSGQAKTVLWLNDDDTTVPYKDQDKEDEDE